MLTEKLRAISGQRRFAISRDIYDIYHSLMLVYRWSWCGKRCRSNLPPKACRQPLFRGKTWHRVATFLKVTGSAA